MKGNVFKTSTDADGYHYIEGVVYEPLAVDTDFESMLAEDVRKMAHDFLASGKVAAIDTQHNRVESGVEVVESFITRKGDPDYPEGAWVLKCRVLEGEVWEAIRSGELNGFSFDAIVTKVPKKVLVDMVRIALGETEANTDTMDVEPHTHDFYIEFDAEGRILVGVTDEAHNHSHIILGTVVTESAMGHTHRFFVE